MRNYLVRNHKLNYLCYTWAN